MDLDLYSPCLCKHTKPKIPRDKEQGTKWMQYKRKYSNKTDDWGDTQPYPINFAILAIHYLT